MGEISETGVIFVDYRKAVVAMEDCINGCLLTVSVEGQLDRVSFFPLSGAENGEDFLRTFESDDVVEFPPNKFDRILPEDYLGVITNLADHLCAGAHG